MKAPLIVALACLFVFLSHAVGSRVQDLPALFPDGYVDADTLTVTLQELAEEHGESVRLSSLAKTREERDVWMLTLGQLPEEGETAPPALLIVANLEADHLVGSQVALALVQRIIEAKADDETIAKFLDEHTLYTVPRLNPDGAERALDPANGPFRTNVRPTDEDRDGQADEDGPSDIDGDGVVVRMRVQDETATLVPDDKEPRLLRRADRAKGERPIYSEYDEGRDDDNDGQLNEDPIGGVNLNRNWPHDWTEYNDQTGFSPASEPEVRALIQFCYDHPEIAMVWTFTLHDNLRAEPKKPASKLNDADFPFYVELSKLYREIVTPRKPERKDEEAEAEDEDENGNEGSDQRGGLPPPNTSALGATTDGAMSAWAYQQYGALALASSLWPGPTLPEPEEGEDKPPADGDARWFYWNDNVLDGAAFVPFQEVEHPDLGTVEIGGWKPGVRINPPIVEVEAITDQQFAFLKELVGKFATLEIIDVKVSSKGGGLFEIEAAVLNSGYLPTAMAQGVRTRQAAPVVVRLHAGDAKLLAGSVLERINALAGSGGRQEYRWLVHASEGVDSVELEASCPRAGRVVETIKLEE